MTPTQARKRWCPMTPRGLPHPETRCIAGDCMMWRIRYPARRQSVGDPDQYGEPTIIPAREENGYCGLSRPEEVL